MRCRHQDTIGRPKLSAKATVSSQLNQVWPRRAAKTSWQNHAILWEKSHHNTNKSGPWTSEGAFFAEITWFPLNSVLRGSSHSLKYIEILQSKRHRRSSANCHTQCYGLPALLKNCKVLPTNLNLKPSNPLKFVIPNTNLHVFSKDLDILQ